MSKRGNHPVNIPDVLIPYKLGDLNDHPDYQAAKAGDFEAALRIAQQMITDSVANEVVQRFGTQALLLPVLAQEAQGRNKIPLALAIQLEALTGLGIELGIGQRTKVSRTTMSGLDRVFIVPEFEGIVLAKQSYILIDDTLTQGGTFASLASHLQQFQGVVSGAFALTGKQYSARLNLDFVMLQLLRDKYGDLETLFTTVTGYDYAALTQSEARTLVSFRPPESVRVRIINERDATSGFTNADDAE
ncbi:MAG: phosphoribosyltransferase [Thiofilum sp.]|uniref:phosphoribosyltransferase n=1 Tax=Thiofilum sp. TaxID=2212733 RepID=UPI0025F0949B|nr:phosphoribosyltransferase [Thiofilum sp.]MBK8453309.1 phosphoribosyltransferase [Thiofilum sp.]